MIHAISPLVPPTQCQWCGAAIPIRGPACPKCIRFGTPGYTDEQIGAVGGQLTPAQREALLKFEVRHFYGPTLPKDVSAQIKPRLAALGLLRRETRRTGGAGWYGLSVLGEKVRERLETGTGSTVGKSPVAESDAPNA